MKLAAAAVLTAAFLATPAFAQTADAPPAGDHGPGMHQGGPGGMDRGMATHVAPITNAPFSAKYTVTAQHTAPGPDGVVKNFTTTDTVYRDSLGRTREDFTLPATMPYRSRQAAGGTTATPKALGALRTVTVIADPVANTITRLMPDRKIAVVQTVPADFFKHQLDREAKQGAGTAPRHHADNSTTADLGSKTFAGVVASGKRTTVTFPAHAGETTASTMTHETWFSPDLKLQVSSTETGGHGTHADTLTALTKAEPDATLFKVPEGYTVQNAPAHTPGNMHHGGRGPGTPPDAPPPSI